MQGDNVALGGQGRYTHRPTITYTPMTGSEFLGNLLAPIEPSALFSAIQSGWPADILLILGVDSINGIRNDLAAAEGYVQGGDDIKRVARLLRRAQQNGVLSVRVRELEGGKKILFVLRDPAASDAALGELRELRDLLGLAPGKNEYDLQLGDRASNDNELAVQTRSLFKILQVLGYHVDVPAKDVADGRALAGAEGLGREDSLFGFVVHNSIEAPQDAYVTAKYRDKYFYIDDRDVNTKRLFTLIMLLYALAEGAQALPSLTIPVQ